MAKCFFWGVFALFGISCAFNSIALSDEYSPQKGVLDDGFEGGDIAEFDQEAEDNLVLYLTSFFNMPLNGVVVEKGRWGERFWVGVYYPGSFPIPDYIDVAEFVDGSLCLSNIRDAMAKYSINDLYAVRGGDEDQFEVFSCTSP